MRRRQGRCDGLGLYRLLAGKALRSLVAKRLFCLKSVPAFIRVDWNGIVVERAGSGQIDRPLAVHSFAHPTPRFVRLLTPLLLHPIRFRRRPLFRSPLFFHQGGSRQFHLLIDPSLPIRFPVLDSLGMRGLRSGRRKHHDQYKREQPHLISCHIDLLHCFCSRSVKYNGIGPASLMAVRDREWWPLKADIP